VHDQVSVCFRHRSEHIQKQPNAASDAEPALVAIDVNVIAFNIFEDEVRLPNLRHPGIDQFGDVGMNQQGEYSALAFESLLATHPHQGKVEKLYGYPGSNRPSFRSASQTLPMPPCPICETRV
jgi:hypothetical protein